MIIALLLIAVFLIGGFVFTQAYADHTAMTVRLAEISAQNRHDLAPYVLTALVIVAVAVVLIFYFRRPAPVVNDNRTMYLMLPDGQSRRQAYKSLGTYNALPLAPGARIERLENENVKLLKGG